MKRDPMPLGIAIPLSLVGLLLGSIFTFGMSYWNANVSREECHKIHTEYITYTGIRYSKRPTALKEILIDCENNARYYIDGISITSSLLDKLALLDQHEQITLLVHPHSNVILEFSTETDMLLTFEDTLVRLGSEKIGFLFLGAFMYLCAALSIYHILLHFVRRKKIH